MELWKNPRITEDTPICTFYKDSSVKFVIADNILKFMYRTAEAIGKDKLSFSSEDLGTYLVCSRAAMAIFLDNIQIFLIILVEC